MNIDLISGPIADGVMNEPLLLRRIRLGRVVLSHEGTSRREPWTKRPPESQ